MRPQRRKAFILSLFLLALPSTLLAQSEDDALIARIQQAAIQTALDTDSAQPFHLKLTLHLDPQHGRPAEDGTVELFWSSPNSHRTVYDLPSYKAIFLETPAGRFTSPDAKSVPYLVRYTIDHILQPIPANIHSESYKASLTSRSFGKIRLECIALTSAANKPLAPMPTTVSYCFEPGNTTLRLTLDTSGQDSLRQVLGNFRNQSVPIKLDYTFYGKPVAQAHIEKLSGQTQPFAETSDTSGLTPITPAPTRLQSGVVAGSILHKVQPTYPETAKRNHIAGAVVLHAIIDVNGRIKDLELIGSPDDSLTDAAMDAVRNWLYAPYLLNGAPTEVDTTITVNFNFAPAHL